MINTQRPLRIAVADDEIAAEAMGITAERLSRLNVIDEVIAEPLGGAHRDPQATAESLREALARQVAHAVERVLGPAGERPA